MHSAEGQGSPGQTPQRPAAPAHGPSGALPAPPAPKPSAAPREEFQPFPLRRAVCSLLAARPQRGPRWGPGGAGQSRPHLAAAPAYSGFPPPALFPGDQTGLSSSPGPAWRPGLRLLPGRLPPEPLPAPRSAPPASSGPAEPPPRPPWTPGSPQSPSLKPKLALAASAWGKSLSLLEPQFLLW